MIHLTIYTRSNGSIAYATIEATAQDKHPVFKVHQTEEQAQQHAEELSESLGQGIARIITTADPED